MKKQGRELQFISLINRDFNGRKNISKKDMSYLDNTEFEVNRLSMTNETYIAAATLDLFVVKLKNEL